MEQPQDRVETFNPDEGKKRGRTAQVLEHYANTVERRDLVDSDFGPVLRRAVALLREYCPEVKEYEAWQQKWK